jgi:hypothetical protein
MIARFVAFFLLIAAALADGAGAHSGAFYFLFAAVPVVMLGALSTLGELADVRDLAGRIVGLTQALLSSVALALAIVVVGSSSGPLLDVPAPVIGISALETCLGVFALQAGLGAVARALRRPIELYARAGEEFATLEHIGL